MNVHICILSGQTMQNILPLSAGETDLLLLASSHDFLEKNKAKDMQLILNEMGWIPEKIKDTWVMEPMPSSGFAAMCEWAEKQINFIHEQAPDARITLNATGGTKLMSLALVKALEQPQLKDKVEIIYCDTGNDSLEIIYPVPALKPLPSDLITSEEILKTHRIRINEADSDKEAWKAKVMARAELTGHLGKHMHDTLGSFISSLNGALGYAINKRKLEHIQFPLNVTLHKPIGFSWKYVLGLMGKFNLIKPTEPLNLHKPASFMVPTLEALRYLHGVWLEEYVWMCFLQGTNIKDLHCSAKISSIDQNDKSFKDNELDVVVGHRNKLIVVECKTVSPTQDVMNEPLDKLKSISDRSGGLLAESWFVMARWPHDNPEQEERFRLQAKERGVILIEPRHLANLTERLEAWSKDGSSLLK